MARASADRPTERVAKKPAGGPRKDRPGRTVVIRRGAETCHAAPIDSVEQMASRIEAVMRAAEQSGLLREKNSRIGGRVSQALVRQAKRQTGIETDTDLIEFALATVALEDNFADTFKESRGKVDPDLKLGF